MRSAAHYRARRRELAARALGLCAGDVADGGDGNGDGDGYADGNGDGGIDDGAGR